MWPNPQFPADLVTFTEEILNGKLHFCAVKSVAYKKSVYTSPFIWFLDYKAHEGHLFIFLFNFFNILINSSATWNDIYRTMIDVKIAFTTSKLMATLLNFIIFVIYESFAFLIIRTSSNIWSCTSSSIIISLLISNTPI